MAWDRIAHRHSRLTLWLTAGGLSVFALAFWACGEPTEVTTGPTGPTGPDPTAVTSVTLSPATFRITALNATQTVSATAKNSAGSSVSGKTFTWTSSDTTVATVSSTGVVTARRNGTATIRASTDGVTGSASAEVEQLVRVVEVKPDAATLVALGDTVRYEAVAEDSLGSEVANATFTWTSSDTTVCTVPHGIGLVTAVSTGAATITAQSAGYMGTANLSVVQELSVVTVTSSPDTLVALGDTLHLTATASDANGNEISGVVFSWTSSDPTVLEVDAGNGVVTALSNGSAVLTAEAGTVEGTAALTVLQRVATVVVTPDTATTVSVGGSQQFVVQAWDANDSLIAGAVVVWSSSDEAVAAVDGVGYATAEGAGLATITATSGGVPGSAVLKVLSGAQETVSATEADTVISPSGMTVIVPAGAISGSGVLTMIETDSTLTFPDTNETQFGTVIDVQLEGADLIGTVTIEFPLDPSSFDPDTLLPEDLRIAYLDAGVSRAVPTSYDSTRSVLTATVDHLSHWYKLRYLLLNAGPLEGDGYSIRWVGPFFRAHAPMADALFDPDGLYPDDEIPDYIEAVEQAVEYGIAEYVARGYRLPDTVVVNVGNWGSELALSELWIDNDLAEMDQLAGFEISDILPVVVVHELFHAVQYEYADGAAEDRWLRESTAMWMEMQLYPDVRDADGIMRGWRYLLQDPSPPFDSLLKDSAYTYSHFPFFEFLAARYGDGIVREIWEAHLELGLSVPLSLSATDAALVARGSNLSAEFLAFADQYLYLHSDAVGSYSDWNDFKLDWAERSYPSLEFDPFFATLPDTVFQQSAGFEWTGATDTTVAPTIPPMAAYVLPFIVHPDPALAGTFRLTVNGPERCFGGSVFVSSEEGQEPFTEYSISPPTSDTTFTDIGVDAQFIVVVLSNCDWEQEATLTVDASFQNKGTIDVVTTTTGSSLDPDGYSVVLDGGTGAAIGINNTVAFEGLAAGAHVIELQGLAPNCEVTGANPDTVSVSAAEVTTVSFAVECGEPGGVVVITSTFGPDSTDYIYRLFVDEFDWGRMYWSDTSVVRGLPIGEHTLFLTGIPANCVVSQNPSIVTILIGEDTEVPVNILCGSLVVSEAEPNDLSTNAKRIHQLDAVEAAIDPASDVDWYEFEVPTASHVDVLVTASIGEGLVHVALASANGDILEAGDGHPWEAPLVVTHDSLGVGTYRLRVTNSTGCTGDCPTSNTALDWYAMLIRSVDVHEPNDSLSVAKVYAIGDTIRASIYPAEDHDVYRIELSAPSDLRLYFGAPSGDGRLWGSLGLLGRSVYASLYDGELVDSTMWANVPAGSWYVDAANVEATTLAAEPLPFYWMVVDTTILGPGGDSYEPNDSEAAAALISIGDTINAEITGYFPDAEVDYFRIDLVETSDVTVSFGAPSGEGRLRVVFYREGFTWSSIGEALLYDGVQEMTIGGAGLEPGTYYIRIHHLKPDNWGIPLGTYWLTVSTN